MIFCAKTLFFLRIVARCVLGSWPQVFFSLTSRGGVLGNSVLGLEFFLCPWPWPRALCPRLHSALEFSPAGGRSEEDT